MVRDVRLDRSIACVGEALWDFFERMDASAAPPGERKRPGAVASVVPEDVTYERRLGGASANVATVLARLGAASKLVGAVGADRLGQALVAHLRADRVDVQGVFCVQGARTPLVLVTRDARGEPSFAPYRSDAVESALAQSVAVADEAFFRDLGIVVASTTTMRAGTKDALCTFVDRARSHGALLVVDLNVRPHLWPSAEAMQLGAAQLVANAAVVKASDVDLQALAGKRGMSWLQTHAPTATWIVTHGDSGAACIGAHGQVSVACKRVRCIDATGAGDAFTAGVVAVLARCERLDASSEEWRDAKLWTLALDVGSQLGSKAVAAVGAVTGIVNLEDIVMRLRSPIG